jgi:MerR family transcriptional regulator, redox-sensitive transcriptional activator SoxR
VTTLLLSIGEVAERAGMAASAMRYYESEGLITSVRSSGGQRRYGRDVLRRLAFIRVAQRVGLSLEDIRAAFRLLPEGRTPTKADWTRLSRSWRPVLDDQIAVLERLRDQLDSCIGCGCLSLQRCSLYNPGDQAARFGSGPRYLFGDPSAESGAKPSVEKTRSQAVSGQGSRQLR